MSSCNLSENKATIPILKKVVELEPSRFTMALSDAGYDNEPIYRRALSQTMVAVIPFNVQQEDKIIGLDHHFDQIGIHSFNGQHL